MTSSTFQASSTIVALIDVVLSPGFNITSAIIHRLKPVFVQTLVANLPVERQSLGEVAGQLAQHCQTGSPPQVAFLSTYEGDFSKSGESGIRTNSKTTGISVISGQVGAECGAALVRKDSVDADLQKLIETWPRLPETLRADMLKLINAHVSVSTTS